MLKSVSINNGFKHHDVTYHFGKGLTTITGPNESGKSLIIEFARYAWFGVKALRGKADDYKRLQVKSEAQINGVDYKVERKASNAILYRNTPTGWEAIAAGTAAVNQKVPELFGYGLDVFDAAHAVNQGQIEALGTMKPAERKRMVDSVIGLTVLDDLLKFSGDMATSFTRDAEAIESVLVEPVQPVKPVEFKQSSDFWKGKVEALTAANNELSQINGWLQRVVLAPTEVADCPITQTAETLKEYERNRQTAVRNHQALEMEKARLKLPSLDAEGIANLEHLLDVYERAEAYRLAMAEMPEKPMMPIERVIGQREYLRLYNLKKAEHDRSVYLWQTSKLECPSCQHEWSHKGHEKPADFTMEPPDFTAEELDVQERRIKAWEKAPEFVEPWMGSVPTITRRDIAAEKALLGNVEKLAEIEAKLAVFKPLPDLSEQLATRIKHEAEVEQYNTRKAEYDAYVVQRQLKETRAAELVGTPALLAEAQARLTEAVIYERDLATYTIAAAKHGELLGKVATARTSADQYKRAKNALMNLKVKVKSHLVPSLNRVASSLLSQMTNGARQSIEVDEDFNIKVDGFDLEALSGSGKAVANLAIRIGLGQVLTNRVFSVFIGDELDAAMDDDRAGATAETLRGLSSKISQLILVTHKRPQSDNTIDLTEAA